MIEINQETDIKLREEIKTGLQAAISNATDIKTTLHNRKMEQLSKRYSDLALSERAFFSMMTPTIDWERIHPTLVWCKSDEEKQIWDYARNVVSSMPENSVIGRQMRYYFMDENSGRWLGIVCLASALTLTTPRHQLLKWDTATRFANLCKIMNVAVCVPIQPFGTLCGGKLLFVSSLSNEVREKYKSLYGDDLLAVETTSLYGKSSQYNRVKEFEYLGLTKGDGNVHVSRELWTKVQQYLSLHPEYDTAGGSSVKLRRINDVARAVGLSGTKSTHGQRRGFYWGVTASNSNELLCNKTTEPPNFFDRLLKDLIDFWYNRWYLMRLPKKKEEVEQFDLESYRLDFHVPPELRKPRQIYLL